MELFSKRYTARSLRRYGLLRRSEDGDPGLFLNELTRKRLHEEIKYVVSSNEFLERFLVVYDEKREIFNFNATTLRDLSQRELGYDIDEIYNFKQLSFNTENYSDLKFFDLVELLFVFSKKEKREEFIIRIGQIFKEDNTGFVIHDSMIYDKNVSGLRSIIPLIKDQLLKKKLEEIYGISSNIGIGSSILSDEVRARTSADVLQFLFSSPKTKKSTAKVSQEICQSVASKWTSVEHKKELAGLLSDTVKNAKLLNNQITNVRHADQYTIPVDMPSFYKLIAVKNVAIIELIILSLPEKYISENKPEFLKNKYIEKYHIDPAAEWFIRKEPEITIEDVPF